MTPAVPLPGQYNLVALDSVDSTNEEAKRRAAQGAADGSIVWAGRQTAGRGRRGRSWASEPGNLYTSIVLRPRCSAATAMELTFVAALGVRDAVAAFLPKARRGQVKWPNDVLVEGRKIAGILLESSASQKGGIDWLVIGVGLNVAHHPEATEFPATSLAAQADRIPPVETVLSAYYHALADWNGLWARDGFGPVREAWLRRAAGLGEAIEVRLPQETLSGTFAGLDPSGALILKTASESRRIMAGDVFPVAA